MNVTDFSLTVRPGVCPPTLYLRLREPMGLGYRRIEDGRFVLTASHGEITRTIALCAQIDSAARVHVKLQTELVSDDTRPREVVRVEFARASARLRKLVGELPGGPWNVEMQGRGGGLLVVLSLKNDPGAGDGLGGGWNIGVDS